MSQRIHLLTQQALRLLSACTWSRSQDLFSAHERMLVVRRTLQPSGNLLTVLTRCSYLAM